MENLLFANASEERFFGASDSETIQNAVDFAHKAHLNRVVIPHMNARTGEEKWIIERAILLPDYMTVVLADAVLRLADGVYDNIFRNGNIGTPLQNTLEGEQSKINIMGSGNAILEGGRHNGLTEQYLRDHPDSGHSMVENFLIYFSNVREFEISGIHVYDSRYWALAFYFCRMGRIHDICFSNHATVENQDGIDLRTGCHSIIIENITGITGDDTVALTNLPLAGNERRNRVEGKNFDIHDIIIRNVISSTHGCGLIRFLNEDGAKIYGVTVDTVTDTGRSVGGTDIIIGCANTGFVREHLHTMGDFKDITIRNARLNAQTGFSLSEPCENLKIENVTFFGRCKSGISVSENFRPKNVKIRDLYFDTDDDDGDCLFRNRSQTDFDASGLCIENAYVKKANYIWRGRKIPVDRLKYESVEDEFSSDIPKFPSPYGRYFKYFYGKEPDTRPKDNRFTGKTQEDNL